MLEVLELLEVEVYLILILPLGVISSKLAKEELAWIAFYTTYGSLPKVKEDDYVLWPNKYQ